MAFSKMTVSERLVAGEFSFDTTFIASAGRERIVIRDAATGGRLIYEGEKMKVVNGEIVKGTIDDISLVNSNGKPLIEFNDTDIRAKALGGGDIVTFFNNLVEAVVLKPNKVIGSSAGDSLISGDGNDIIRGRGGNDFIGAGGGNDVMKGGGGNDMFEFAPAMGRDTIKDFDGDGGIGFQDLIQGDFESVTSITQQGKHTVISFESGDSFVLRNVDAATIDQSDFVTQL